MSLMESQLFWLWYRGLLNLCRMAIHGPRRASVHVKLWLAFTTLLFQLIIAGYGLLYFCTGKSVCIYFISDMRKQESLKGINHALGCWDKLFSWYKWKRWQSPRGKKHCKQNTRQLCSKNKTDPMLRNSTEDICIRTLLLTVCSIFFFSSSYVTPDLWRPLAFPKQLDQISPQVSLLP